VNTPHFLFYPENPQNPLLFVPAKTGTPLEGQYCGSNAALFTLFLQHRLRAATLSGDAGGQTLLRYLAPVVRMRTSGADLFGAIT
jgi:hypothetical protein